MTSPKKQGVKKVDPLVSAKKQILEFKGKLKEMDALFERMRQRETVFQDIFDTAPVGIAYATLGGELISINRALESLLETPREKLIGKNITKIVPAVLHRKDVKHIVSMIREMISGREIEPFQVACRDKILDVSTNINPKTRMMSWIVRDITENRKAADAHAKSESRLQRAELASKSGNWELHLDTGKIHGSAGALKLYGTETGSLDYKDVIDISLPECRQMMDEALHDLITGKKPYNIEFKIRTANTGEILDIHSVAEFDPLNRIVYGAMQDITDRKKIEQQIIRKNKDLTNLFRVTLHLLESLEKKELLAKVVENSANLVGTDTSAIYLVNGQDLLLEVASPPLPDDFPAEFRKAKLEHHPHIKAAIDTLKTVIVSDASTAEFTQEERLIVDTKNLASLVYIPLFIQNKVHGVIILGTIGRQHTFEKHEIDMFSTFSNITSLALENSYLFENLKETKEKAEESNNLKTAFLHNISHEIRTPLNTIIGFSTLLGQPDLPPEKINEFIGIISQSNNQLLSIIEDILNISRIEARQISLSETWADLNVILTNLYSQYHLTALKKGLEFAIRTSFAGHDPVIMTDEYKIIGVLTNLLNNAFKFTLNGRIELGCNLTDDCVEFYVSDTGIGIPASEQGKIFERFYQIDKSVSRFHGGMGLGLAISAAYVEMLGGRISLNSCQGQGSTFTFVIPYKKE